MAPTGSPAQLPTPGSLLAQLMAGQGSGREQHLSIALRGGYAVLSLHKAPVNSLDLAMWQALDGALTALEAEPRIAGLIIVSGLQRDVFSAGNDLKELYPPTTTASRYAAFWTTSNRFLCRLARSRLATVAAIRGACPAGGCMMSLCCDHRLAVAGGTMGLNEVALGIPVPKYWGLMMGRLIGAKAADKLLLTGKMVTTAEAKVLGLVDQVVDSRDALLPAAERVMAQLVALPGGAVAATKLSLRGDLCAAWEEYYQTEHVGGWAFLNEPDTAARLQGVMARLSGGSASKL